MAMISIGSNLAAMSAERALTSSTLALSQVSQRLSSGLRINHASDDAAGLSIASSLNADARVYAQGIRNINDGVSLLNIAEGAVHELGNITIRLNELAIQSANGTLSNKQRKPLNDEAQQLMAEYNRIVDVTEFNKQAVLTGAANPISIQAGYGESAKLTVSVGGSLASLATPDGTFAAEQIYTGVDGIGPRLGDFNNDGYDDILDSNVDTSSIHVLLSNGNGTFKQSAALSAGSSVGEGAIGDFNSDGNLDFLVSGGDSSTSFMVCLGNGNGTFKATATYDVGGTGNSYTELADFNNDGRLDVVTGSESSNATAVLFGNADGSFGNRRLLTLPEAIVHVRAWAGDFNGDGNMDIVGFDSFTPSSPGLYVMLGNGNGTFKAVASYNSGTRFGRGDTGDVNHDGYDDFVVADFLGGQMYVYLSNSSGSFKASQQFAAASPSDSRLADMNADGNLDILSIDYGGGSINIFLGNGNGSFKAGTSFVSATPLDTFDLGDVNGDGVNDVVATSFGGPGGMSVMIANTYQGTHVWNIDLSTRQDALDSLAQIKILQNAVHGELSSLGSFDSRLNSASSVLQVTRENMLSAYSQIMDADVASEVATMTRLRILQQAGASILAQAKTAPQLALSLLQGR
jgi:flagellin-like hook-associated protein FlgL